MNFLHYTLSKEQIDYNKNLDKFIEISQNVFNKHAPRKKRYIRGNNNPVIIVTYSNKFLKNSTDLIKVLYMKQRNYCVALLRKGKKSTLQNQNGE